MHKIHFLFAFIFLSLLSACKAQENQPSLPLVNDTSVIHGAEQMEIYLPYIMPKRIALVANHTSLIGTTHLADTLIGLKVKLKKIFSPEHGFRGNADAGAKVQNGIDPKTGIPVISLYGKHKKPTPGDLQDIDIVVFDIQDVGTRFYTYISTLTLVMEACAEQDIPLLVLDRPNPNGFYVDGPILEPGYESFVGMHPIPIVHGLTIGEYAHMANDEGWLKNGIRCDLTWVNVKQWDHGKRYQLPVKPSPNLPTMASVYLYPSLCLFEGTDVSIGRGTPFPFEVYGHPKLPETGFSFTPQPVAGASMHPKHQGLECRGKNLQAQAIPKHHSHNGLQLNWLITSYNDLKDSIPFFNTYFNRLAGTDQLQKAIIEGQTEAEIKESWKEPLETFKKRRKKYLHYPDFE